jgi:mismatch-specific thymine-DNA glycosylase
LTGTDLEPAPGERRPGWALPDYLRPGLRLVVVGTNPGLRSAEAGHYYAHPLNAFWRLLHEAGLTPRRFQPQEDRLLPSLGIGLTDIVKRASAGFGDLLAAELREGALALRGKLEVNRPRVAAYTGKGIYRALAGLPAGAAVAYGRQRDQAVAGVIDFVLPSPSGRSGLRHTEKLGWYRALAGLLAAPPPR